jgi:hypothetical protein
VDAGDKRALVACFAVGVLVGVIGLSAYAASTGGALTQSARIKVVNGYTTGVDATGSAIGVRDSQGRWIGGYWLSGARWSPATENWHEGFDASQDKSCVPPLSSGQKLRLGIVDVPATDTVPGGPMIVWFQCLSGPSKVAGA